MKNKVKQLPTTRRPYTHEYALFADAWGGGTRIARMRDTIIAVVLMIVLVGVFSAVGANGETNLLEGAKAAVCCACLCLPVIVALCKRIRKAKRLTEKLRAGNFSMSPIEDVVGARNPNGTAAYYVLIDGENQPILVPVDQS